MKRTAEQPAAVTGAVRAGDALALGLLLRHDAQTHRSHLARQLDCPLQRAALRAFPTPSAHLHRRLRRHDVCALRARNVQERRRHDHQPQRQLHLLPQQRDHGRLWSHRPLQLHKCVCLAPEFLLLAF